jgi:hypothetical protein
MEAAKMPMEDREYYLRRAREERVAAARCEDNGAAKAHLGMAEEYDRRARMIGEASGSRALG